jgi:hypothetical protein
LVLADQKACPPSLCEFITLITYQFSLVTLRLSCCPWPAYHLRTLADTTSLKGVGLSTYVILSFCISLYCRTNHFHSCLLKLVFTKVFFTLPPPGSCHPLFTLLYPFHLPDFLQPACFSACFFFCTSCCLPLLPLCGSG